VLKGSIYQVPLELNPVDGVKADLLAEAYVLGVISPVTSLKEVVAAPVPLDKEAVDIGRPRDIPYKGNALLRAVGRDGGKNDFNSEEDLFQSAVGEGVADCGIISRKGAKHTLGVPPVRSANYKSGVIVFIEVADSVHVLATVPGLIIPRVGLEGFFKDFSLLTVTALAAAA